MYTFALRTLRRLQRFFRPSGGGDDDNDSNSATLARHIRGLNRHVNEEGMSHKLLDDLLQQASLSSRFRGILPDWKAKHFDRLVEQIDMDSSLVAFFIANVGLHYVVVSIAKGEISYCDPFGHAPSPNLHRHFLDRVKLPVRYSSGQIQAASSAFCGLFACLLCIVLDMQAEAAYLARENPRFHRNRKCILNFRRKHPIRFTVSTANNPASVAALQANDTICADRLTEYAIFWGIEYPGCVK